ncbi:enoyl-CoA hydratase/isomerase family protein [Fluviispira multicolorata]|uniref:Ethylmalonyl-CoA decarboxylase n=1 Tax=Fluviispira multicolorata TaxID=2654512 RepID=A0A833JBT6_9BACT|nr:enoyl-CoA hydratase/isomerase family protein [Fluviispira multicolorata]KAB8029071.1 hypothetical protein GCL57_11060 [Fluviispira multicolorata]
MIKLVDGEDFTIHILNNICFVTFSSPSTRNAISLRMSAVMQEISWKSENNISIFEKFLKENNCFLIIVQSTVRGIFSSGGNLSDLKNGSKELCQNYASSIKAFCEILHSCSIPSVTLLAGPAYGGGAELALATDFRWSIGKKSDLHFTQMRFGIPAGWGGMQRLSELCPQLSPKKVSAIIVAKMSLLYDQLIRLNLIDRSFLNIKSCIKALNEWRDEIELSPSDVRYDLMQRHKINDAYQLQEYDIKIFDKYFLNLEHKNRIDNFFAKRNKNAE